MRIHLRDPRPGELTALSALMMRSKAHWGYSAAFMAACTVELTLTPERLVDERVRVAVDTDDRALGVAALAVRDDVAELTALFTEPAHMGRGVGRALWDDALTAARARGARTLHVDADPQAAAWYEARGAVRVGEVPSESIPGRTLPHLRLAL